MAPETVTLTIPRDPRALEIARLVLGGVATRFQLGVDRLDDLRLALEAILLAEPESAGSLSVEVQIGSALELFVGPIGAAVRERLTEERGPLSLRHVLATLVDDVDLVERDDRDWLLLRQRVAAAESRA